MVSIVMPAYNEVEIIEGSVREWYEEVVSKIPNSDLIVVDDCSTDGTGDVLADMKAGLPRLRVVRPSTNGGHGKALRLGFRHVSQEFVFQTDSDRQHLPHEFWKLWEGRNGYDLTVGVRTHRVDGLVRVVISNAMRLVNYLIWGIWIKDANCPFKLMKRDALNQILSKIPETSFIPMVLVSILARKMNMQIREVPVTHLPRKGGSQSLKGLFKWGRVAKVCVQDIMKVRRSWNS